MLANNHDTPEQQLIQFQNKNYSRWQSQTKQDQTRTIKSQVEVIKVETPQELVDCLIKLDGQIIDSISDLVSYVHDISMQFDCSFISKKKKKKKQTRIYLQIP